MAALATVNGIPLVVTDLSLQGAPIILDLLMTSTAADSGLTNISISQSVHVPVVDGAVAIDVSQRDTFRIDLDGPITSFELVGWPSGPSSRRVAVYFVQDEAGDHPISFPTDFKWSNGLPIGPSTSPNAIDCFVFASFDAGVTVFANVVGLTYA